MLSPASISCRNSPSFASAIRKSSSRCVSERTSNLVEEGIDLAIRNGTLSDSSLIARKIGESAIATVASADYLERKGEPKRPSDLDSHDGVIFVSQDGPRRWTFASRAGPISYQAIASFRSNDGEQLRAAVLAGLGITQAPYWLFAADIRAGTEGRILRDRETATVPISAVRPVSRRQPSKVAVFVDFLAELPAETETYLFPNRIDTIRNKRLIRLRRN